jgi:hypothetical protein
MVLCGRPLSAKRPHFFCFPHWQTHTHTHTHIYIYIYIYMTISHATINNTYIYHIHMFIHTTSPSKQVHKSTKCLESNEISSEHDQLSPRAYGECSCGGKGGTGDWKTCSPLGPCWFEPAEKGCTKETRLQVLDMIRQENQKLFGIILTGVPRTCCVGNTCGGGVIGARSPGSRVIPPDVARYLVSSSNLLTIACCDRKYSCCW